VFSLQQAMGSACSTQEKRPSIRPPLSVPVLIESPTSFGSEPNGDDTVKSINIKVLFLFLLRFFSFRLDLF